MAKAVALLSGGLDSMLAIRVLLDQGIAIEALHFVSVFDCGATDAENCASSQRASAQLGVPVRYEEISGELLDIVKNPKHGHGSNMNPCIDCHAMMVRRAARVMREVGADFLCTGEVLGERPMSQRRDSLGMVVRDAGVEGLLLRPLSAQLLDPTIPEQKGWVDRAKLLRISGRCRKPQFELAKALNIGPYPTPAGGCLLTDPGFSARMRDLLKYQPDCTPDDVRLLKVGRHFRLSPTVRAVIGRNEVENGMIENLARAGDLLMDAARHSGPLALVRGPASEAELVQAASVTLRYGKAGKLPGAPVRVWKSGAAKEEARLVEAPPASEEMLDRLRIAPLEGKRRRDAGE
jgi:tRNA-uridine 2-sulfurtransferase